MNSLRLRLTGTLLALAVLALLLWWPGKQPSAHAPGTIQRQASEPPAPLADAPAPADHSDQSGRFSPKPFLPQSSPVAPAAPAAPAGRGAATAAAPAGPAAAARQYDPRLVQPATRMGLFGVRTPEVEAEIQALTVRTNAEKTAAIAWAQANGWPIRGPHGDGGSFELQRLDKEGRPFYTYTRNREARISHNIEPLTQFGGSLPAINLSGYGWLAGMWENGPPRLSHQEFNDFPGRVVYADTGSDANRQSDSHATHVMGTILGNGLVDDRARGMAWRASALCFGSSNDDAEMMSSGATAPGQPSRVYVSNHSYGGVSGWHPYPAGHARAGAWRWLGANGATEDAGFGRYGSDQATHDATCRQTPYLLVFVAAGNERGNNPGNGTAIWFNVPNGSGGFTEVQGTYPNAAAPGRDGGASGYDTLTDFGLEKNIMSVGCMDDAVLQLFPNPVRFTAGIGMASFSSYGPVDDGRIKPDVVANGTDVLSAGQSSDTATDTLSGTSMASPGACGTGLCLQEHYRDKTGQYLRASSLKALMIHTATDVQDAGPDYKSGWGLIDAVAAVAHINLHANEPGGAHIVEGVLSAQQPEFRMTFISSSAVRATLCWADPEGTPQSGLNSRTPVLVNDLDVTLRAPNGTFYRAPQLNPTNPSAAAVYNGNTLDNVEMLGGLPLQLIASVPGVWELAVTHKGTIIEPPPVTTPPTPPPAVPKQVFSLMLQGNVAVNTGTVAEGMDKPDRSFTKHAAATTALAYEVNVASNGGDRATNLDIGDSQSSASETKVTGPVTVTFNWGVSSESGWDFLRFYDNGAKIQEISGTVASTAVVYNVPAGEHTLRWAYEKDGSMSEGSDGGWVDTLEFNSLPEAMDNLPYSFTEPAGSSLPWAIESGYSAANGVPTGDVAKSGNVAALQRSDMETAVQGPALVRFRMVKTGASAELRAQWGPGLSQSILHDSGNVWKRYSIELAPGPQVVRWSYYKPVAEGGFGYADEFEVIPMPSTLRDAVDLPSAASNLVVENPASQPWLADASDAAPSTNSGARGVSAIHSIYTVGANNDTAIRYPIISNLGGTVSFWWQASGAVQENSGLVAGNVSLQMRTSPTGTFVQAGPSVGPRKINAIIGGAGWQQVHVEIPPGYVELRWFYDATTAAGQAWLDQIEFQEGLLHPARGLDHWSARWQTYGASPWAGVDDLTNSATGGVDSTTHGPVTHNQSTTLTTTVTGPKALLFDWKVSSEANWDFLRFYMDDLQPVPALSGESGWQKAQVIIPPGTHVLRWEYSKDASVNAGQDRGWVDQVALLRADYGFGDTGIRFSGNATVVPVRKDPTAGFFLEQSNDLVNWSVAGLGIMLPPRLSEVSVIVPNAGDRAFYRVIYKPEMVHTIENAGFELPVASADTFWDDGPGWGPDNDGVAVSVFERLSAFAPASGAQHMSLGAGAFTETKGIFRGYRGVHSISAAVGNRPAWTDPGNLSSIVLKSGPELARMAQGAAAIPSGTWHRAMPASFDSFESNLDAFYDYTIRLESTSTRGYFDDVRAVTEPQ